MKLYFVEIIKPASSQIFSLEIKKLVPGYFRSASFSTPCMMMCAPFFYLAASLVSN